MMLIKTSDGTNRPVIDFRFFNKQSFFAEPIPRAEEIFAKLASAKFLFKLDFTKGYWQVSLRYADKMKTAFSTSLGLLQFRVMPFELVNAGETYTRMMRF